jgi:hypothetical protein
MVKNQQAVQDWVLPGNKYKLFLLGQSLQLCLPSMIWVLLHAANGMLVAFAMRSAKERIHTRNSNLFLTRMLTMPG